MSDERPMTATAIFRQAAHAVRRFAAQAEAELDAEKAKIAGVARVRYDAEAKRFPVGCPAPRLQLRWEACTDRPGYEWICHYELVFPLREHDIRNDPKTGYCVAELSLTRTGGGEGLVRFADDRLGEATPFRDGAHAAWDSEVLRGLPIYVIAPDGRFARHIPGAWRDRLGRSSP